MQIKYHLPICQKCNEKVEFKDSNTCSCGFTSITEVGAFWEVKQGKSSEMMPISKSETIKTNLK